MVFVGSMSDLFHPDVPEVYIGSVFRAMAQAPQHLYVILTKRPDRAAGILTAWGQTRSWTCRDGAQWTQPAWPLPNLWLGTSVEHQLAADERIPHLLRAPAARRIVSAEPMLGPVDLDPWLWVDPWLWDGWTCPSCGTRHLNTISDTCVQCGTRTWPLRYRSLDWVIAGGETGPRARPAKPAWFASLRDQCGNAGVPFFFKSLGEWAQAPWKLQREPSESSDDYRARSDAQCATHAFTGGYYRQDGMDVEGFMALGHRPSSSERDETTPQGATGMRRASKKTTGRLLDGRTWDEAPEVDQ